MTARISTCTQMRVVLDAASPRGLLAAEVLAAETGLTLAEAAARLTDAPCELHPAIAPEAARRLVRGLSLFGLRVRAEPADGPRQRPAIRFDLALQQARPDPCPRAVGLIAARLQRLPEEVAKDLALPTGLILERLDWASVTVWRQMLGDRTGLRLVVSDPQAATYDLLPSGGPADSLQAVALLLHLRRLGLGPCPLTGAVGAALDHVMRDHVMGRFPRSGFVPVNRDFQRFDLYLTGANGLDAQELDGFLRARAGFGGGPARAGEPPDPLRIECALGRCDALAFQSDYAAIGIETRLRLVWPYAARMS